MLVRNSELFDVSSVLWWCGLTSLWVRKDGIFCITYATSSLHDNLLWFFLWNRVWLCTLFLPLRAPSACRKLRWAQHGLQAWGRNFIKWETLVPVIKAGRHQNILLSTTFNISLYIYNWDSCSKSSWLLNPIVNIIGIFCYDVFGYLYYVSSICLNPK